MITINLPAELETVLADMMRKTGQNAEQIALEALLERLEDFEDVRVAEDRLRNPSGPNIPLEDYEQDKIRRRGPDAVNPHRMTYKRLTR